MRCLVVAMTLVASTVLVHGQHWTPLARRGVIRTYRATGRAWRCWAFLSSVRPASVTKPPSPTKSLRLPERRLTNANDAFFGESRSLERLRQAAAPNLVARRSAERQSSSVDGRGRETDRGDSQRSARTTERPRERCPQGRCISRGAFGSMMPIGNSSGNQIIQAPGLVVIRNEMIHEARVVYLDGRPHVGAAIDEYMGDSRGRWQGQTLVIETTNFKEGGVNRAFAPRAHD